MLPTTVVQWHAALNDFPAILLLLSFVFDVVGGATKRDSLKAAGFWTLMVAAVGAVGALLTGLAAEEAVEHGGSMHLVMERHETLAIAITVLLALLAVWRILRRGGLQAAERSSYLVVAGVGVLAVLWTSHLGGTIVYEYGGGISTSVMREAIEERAGGHEHAPGEEHDHPAAEESDDGEEDDADHTHPPGTPEHDH